MRHDFCMLNFDAVLWCSICFFFKFWRQRRKLSAFVHFSFINVPLPWGAFPQFFLLMFWWLPETTRGHTTWIWSSGAGWRVFCIFNPVIWSSLCALFVPFCKVFAWALISPCLCVHFLWSVVFLRFLRYPPSPAFLKKAIGVSLLGFALEFGWLPFGWDGSPFDCAYSFCSLCFYWLGTKIGFDILSFAFVLQFFARHGG